MSHTREAPIGVPAPTAHTLAPPTSDPVTRTHAPPPADGGAERACDTAPSGGAAAPAAARAPDEVPRDTTPTWELELLVSGAVLFGLVQLTGTLDAWLAARAPHTGLIGTFVVIGGAVFGKVALLALIGCFVVHLALRAYWVALVGAHSVYPHGPRWERLRQYGPIQSELLRERVRPLPEFIGRVDNAASVVFASGFVFALSLATGIVVLAPAGVVVWVLERALGLRSALVVVAALFAPLALLQIGSSLLDYRLKERIDPASRLGQLVRFGLRLSLATAPPSARSLTSVLASNVAPRLVAGALLGGGVLLLVVAAGVKEGESLPGASNYPLFADAGPASLAADRYASLRGSGPAPRRAPWIDDDVVTGPYLRLHIPYRPFVHDRALAAACGDVRPLDFDEDELETPTARAAADAVLRCAARLHRVALDGRTLDSLRLRFLADARSNRRSFVAHVRVAELAPGEHRLTVWPVRRPDGTYDGPPTPYEIPFWR